MMGYMCIFQFCLRQGICLGVGLLGHIVVLFLVFKESPLPSSIEDFHSLLSINLHSHQ